MAVANHEGAKIQFLKTLTSNPLLIGQDVHDVAWQSATVTTRTNQEDILAIGVRGVAAITDNIGSVEATLSGIISYEPGGANYPNKVTGPGGFGLLNKTLNDFVSVHCDIILETRGADALDTGQFVEMLQMFVTGITINIEQNASVTTDWSWIGYSATWADSFFSYNEAPSGDLEIGEGCNFVPLSSKDIRLLAVANHPANTTTGAGFQLQTITFSATINRTEIYVIGQRAPIDRPVQLPFDVTASAESLADGGDLIRNFYPEYVWNRGPGPCDNDSFNLFVEHTSDPDGQRICSALNMRPVDGSLSVSVGNNSTTSMTFTGWDLYI